MSARRAYPLRIPGGRYLAVPKAQLHPAEEPLSPASAWSILQRALVQPLDAGELVTIGQAIEQSGVRSRGGFNRAAVEHAIRNARWVLLPTTTLAPRARGAVTESDGELVKTAKLVTTWIEMEVVDERGIPAAGREYQCMLPDGTIQTGTLDRSGRVRFEGIDPGNCAFSLTGTHRDEWDCAA